MRTVSQTVYKYHELSDSAKATARDWYRSTDCYHWGSENMDSLEAFCTEFRLRLRDYSVGGPWCRGNHVRVEVIDSDVAELSGVRAWKWLTNNHDMPKLLAGNCPWTGYCFDEVLCDELREFMAKPDGRTLGELFQDCAERWLKEFVDDIDYAHSDEAVEESIVINEYEFTESGDFYV